MSPIRRWSAAAVAGLALLVPAACGSDGSTVSTPGGDVRIDRDDDTVTLEDEDGNGFTTSVELPDGFPADEVPLLDGEIVQGIAVDQPDGAGFSVSMEVDSPVAKAYDDAKALLEDAGYTAALDSTGQGFATGGFDDGTWSVLVNVGEIDDHSSVTYTVGPSGQF